MFEVKVLVSQLCLILYDLMDYCSPPGSSVPGVFQARILKCVAISFSTGSSQPNVCSVAHLCLTLRPHQLQPARLLCPWKFPGKNTEVTTIPNQNVCTSYLFSHVWFFVIHWTIACQAPLSMGFSRQEYWSRLPCPPPGDLPDSGIEPTSPVSPALQVDSLPAIRKTLSMFR